MMKVLMVVFGCLLAVIYALKCQHSRLNVREGSDMNMTSESCKNPNETFCVYAWGKDKSAKNESISFSYRGCYSDFEKMHDYYHDPGCPQGGRIIINAINGTLMCCVPDNCNSPDYYHNPGCPQGGSIIINAISGNKTCCTGDNCNSPASTYFFSAFLLVLSISAFFYNFSW